MAYPRIGRRFEVHEGESSWSGHIVPARANDTGIFRCYCDTCKIEHPIYKESVKHLKWLDQDDPSKMTRAEAEEYLWSLTRKS